MPRTLYRPVRGSRLSQDGDAMAAPRSPTRHARRQSPKRSTRAAESPRRIIWVGAAAAASLAAIYIMHVTAPAYASWVATALVALWGLYSWSLTVCLLGPCLVPFLNQAAFGEEQGATLTRFFALFTLLGLLLNWKQWHTVRTTVSLRFWAALLCIGCGYLLASAVDLRIHPEHTHEALLSAGKLAVRLWFWIGTLLACLVVRDIRLILLGWIFFAVMMLGASMLLYATTGTVLATRGEVALGVGGWNNISALIAAVGFLSVAGGAACFAWGKGTNPLWLVMGAAMIGSTIFSGRRQALLAAVLTVCLCFLIARNYRALVIAGVCFATAFILIQTGPLAEFLEKRESIGMELRGEGTGRLRLLTLGLTYVKSTSPPRLILGLGLDGHSRFAAEQGVTSLVGAEGGRTQEVGISAHNDFIGALMEGGLLALIGAIFLAGEFFRVLREAVVCHSSTARRGPVLPFFIAAAGVLISAMAVSNFITQSGYAILGGMILGAGYRLAQSQKARATSLPPSVPGRLTAAKPPPGSSCASCPTPRKSRLKPAVTGRPD